MASTSTSNVCFLCDQQISSGTIKIVVPQSQPDYANCIQIVGGITGNLCAQCGVGLCNGNKKMLYGVMKNRYEK